MSGLILPDDLNGRPFSFAEGLQLGLSERQLRSIELERPTRGVRMVNPPRDLIERAGAYSLVMPDGSAFSHFTAAQLWGIPLSARMEDDRHLHVIYRGPDRRMRREGVVGHRGLEIRDTSVIKNLPVVGAADTWVDLGELTGLGNPVGLDDLIVAGDAVAQVLGEIEPLRRALGKRIRPRGKRMLVPALRMVRLGAESGMETRVRLLFVRAGLPEPELNASIYTARGRFLGRADVAWRRYRVTGEYQGSEFHAHDNQKRKDRRRRKGFHSDGWLSGDIWADDMRTSDARRACVLRFAKLLCFPEDQLTLDACEPQFFSQEYWDALVERRARRRQYLRLLNR